MHNFWPRCDTSHLCSIYDLNKTNKLLPQLATDPFGLYTAYIHEDCVHEYMEYLCKPEKEEPATMFGDEDDLQVLPDPAPTTTDDQGSGVAANQSNNATALNGNQGTFLPTAISNSARALPDEDFIGRMENLLDDAFHNTAQRAKAAGPLKQKLDATGRTPSPNVLCTSQQSHLEQLWKQGGSLQSAPHFTKNGPIGLSWAKINGAGGTRMDPTKNKAQQGETMKTSAGLVGLSLALAFSVMIPSLIFSQYFQMAVTTLGWEHYDLTPDSGRRMKSGCHIAEVFEYPFYTVD